MTFVVIIGVDRVEDVLEAPLKRRCEGTIFVRVVRRRPSGRGGGAGEAGILHLTAHPDLLEEIN